MGKEFTQIHIVPFDIGLAFIDVLAVDNTRNLMLAQKFIQVLSARANAISPEIQVYDNLKVSFSDNKAVKYSFKTKDVAENAICYVKLMPNLYCYILSSGQHDGLCHPLGTSDLSNLCGEVARCNATKQASALNRGLFAAPTTVQRQFFSFCDITLTCVMNGTRGTQLFVGKIHGIC